MNFTGSWRTDGNYLAEVVKQTKKGTILGFVIVSDVRIRTWWDKDGRHENRIFDLVRRRRGAEDVF